MNVADAAGAQKTNFEHVHLPLSLFRFVFRATMEWNNAALARCRSDGEGGPKGRKRRFRIAGGEGLHADRAAIAHIVQRPRHSGVVDLAGPRLPSSRHVGDLDLPDPWLTS